MIKIRLILTFYKSFFFASSIITISCWHLNHFLGSSSNSILLCFKVITLGLLSVYIINRKLKEFYYYKNLGLSKNSLFSCTLGFDFLIFLTLIIFNSSLR